MVPATAIAVVVFVLIVAPGITFELLRQTRRPAFDQTALEELARVVLASIVLLSSAAAILALASLVFTDVVLDVAVFAARGPSWYWREHPGLVISTVVLEISLAATLAILCHRSLNRPDNRGWAAKAARGVEAFLRHESGHQVERFGLWRTLLRDSRPTGADTQVTLLKTDGALITGLVGGYDTTGSSGQRDIALSQPIQVYRSGWSAPQDVPSEWKYLIVSGAEISELFVTWPPSPSEK